MVPDMKNLQTDHTFEHEIATKPPAETGAFLRSSSSSPSVDAIAAVDVEGSCTRSTVSVDDFTSGWKRMDIESGKTKGGDNEKGSSLCCGRRISITKFSRSTCNYIKSHWTILLVTFLVFCILAGSGLGLVFSNRNGQYEESKSTAMDLAIETGRFFSEELDRATLPLFSLAQFAAELPIFHPLNTDVGPHGTIGSLPMQSPTHRNLTGSLCEDPTIVQRFDEIASTIKRNAKMEGVLVLLEFVPQGVVCLLHPKNNTEDFPPGIYYDPTLSKGLDLFSDKFRWHGETTAKNGDSKVTIAGPMKLQSCRSCHPAVEMGFMARLPVPIPGYSMEVPPSTPGGQPVVYPYWGFAVTKINWKALVDRSGMYETFERKGHEFLLTRTDSIFNTETGEYDKKVVVLAESPGYDKVMIQNDGDVAAVALPGFSSVKTALNTTNNEWEMTVTYDDKCLWMWWALLLVFVMSLSISYLVYLLLVQKQLHTEMVGRELAQEAKVNTERDMTSYFAHELRNPLGAIDSALKAMPENLPEAANELLAGMKLCSSFMSGVMNNLLDVRQMEEGKMTLQRMPLALDTLVKELHKMFLPSVRQGVRFQWRSTIKPNEANWVIGDIHRIQQIFTNVISNALKYTSTGSVTITIGWDDETDDGTERTESNVDSTEKTFDSRECSGSKLMRNSINRRSTHRKRNNDPTKHQQKQDVLARKVRFECADTGPGIPKHVQKQLFKRFVRRGGAPGTGLGLAISKHIVDLMNGQIYFESDPTVKPGATCIVELPLAPCLKPEIDGDGSSSENPSSTSGKSTVKSKQGGGKTDAGDLSKVDEVEPIDEEIDILIVDDIKMNRIMLKRRFLKGIAKNCRISEATTGEETLEICKRESFAVIIVDQYMESAGGVMLGTDTVIALKRMGVASLIIGCSGNDMEQDFQEAGADYCWKKPLPSNETIIEQLRTALKP